MKRPTILAPTAAALMAACANGGAQVAEPVPGVVTEPHPTTTAPEPVAEDTTTTGPTTTATSEPARRPPITVTTTTVAEPQTDDEWAADGWGNDDYRGRILACIRSHEQGAAGYATETDNGYHGAYQFLQSTWDGAVAGAGYPGWVGRPAGHAPAYVQDAAAWWLYLQSGFGPWPTPSRLCRAVA